MNMRLMGKMGLMAALLLAPAVTVLLEGCRTATREVVTAGVTNTVTVNELDPMAGETISGVLAIGVPYAVQADENSGPYLQLVATAFRAAADSGNFDPKSLQSALDNISVRELRDPTAQRLVTTALRSALNWQTSVVTNGKRDRMALP